MHTFDIKTNNIRYYLSLKNLNSWKYDQGQNDHKRLNW